MFYPAVWQERFFCPFPAMLRHTARRGIFHCGEAFVGDCKGFLVENDQINVEVVGLQEFSDGLCRRFNGDGGRAAEYARRDQREGDGGAAALHGETQGFFVAAGEEGFLVVFSVPPDGSDGVDDIARGQEEGGGDGCVACGDVADFLPGAQKPRSRRYMNGAVYAAAHEGVRIRGVDDDVRFDFRDVVFDEVEGHSVQSSLIGFLIQFPLTTILCRFIIIFGKIQFAFCMQCIHKIVN